MRVFFNLIILCLSLFFLVTVGVGENAACEENSQDYIGTWKGENLGDLDIVVTIGSSTFEIDLFLSGTTKRLIGSSKGTFDSLRPNSVCNITETEIWNGEGWTQHSATRFVEFSITGEVLIFRYDSDDNHTLPWDVEGKLSRQ